MTPAGQEMHSHGPKRVVMRLPVSSSTNTSRKPCRTKNTSSTSWVCAALAWLDEHDRQGEVAGRDDAGIAVLAGAAGADEAVLRPLEAIDLGVLEGRPIRLAVAEPAHIAIHDGFDR